MKKLITTTLFILKELAILALFIGAVSFCTKAYAADEAYVPPHTFVKGETAKAADMNEMFAAIQAIVNSNLVIMYDYGPPQNTIRTFQHTNSPTTLTVITYGINMETWQYSDGHKIEYLTAEGPEGTLETGRREFNTSGVMTQDLTYFPAIQGVDLLGPKEVGKTWGGGYIAKKPDLSIYGAETKMFTILAIEDVTVPAGTFVNAIKVYVQNNYTAVVWYAEGVGMVKQIGVFGLMELK